MARSEGFEPSTARFVVKRILYINQFVSQIIFRKISFSYPRRMRVAAFFLGKNPPFFLHPISQPIWLKITLTDRP